MALAPTTNQAEQHKQAAIEWLQTLVAFPTVSRESNMALITHVRDFLASIGATVTVVPSPDHAGKANLLATFPAGDGTTDGGILFSGHSDVVPVDGQPWDTDPFVTTEKAGKIYGRGTCDMKGFSACFLAMAATLRDLPRTKPFHFMLSYDEEVGCIGAPFVIEALGKTLPRPDLVVVGEPTLMRPVSGHKAIASFETTVTGYEIHSSRLPQGVSAVEYGARVADYLFQQNQRMAIDDRFDPPHTTIHVGVMKGGTARNIVALHCGLEWEIRGTPDFDMSLFMQDFEQFTAQLERTMQAVHPATSIRTVPQHSVVGFAPRLDSEAEQLARSITGENAMVVESYCSESGQFQAAGFPTILLGPGDIAQAHQPNEWIEITQMVTCLDFLLAAVSRHCGKQSAT
ncbi:MAG: acetylornithine deacetylase [Alphaproteobacteria bacterium]|nr:acetylornithine deacetylase [Alphaproteobacteria bacterium]